MKFDLKDIRVKEHAYSQGFGYKRYVVVIHIPTGITVTEHSQRSAHLNAAKACDRMEKIVAMAEPRILIDMSQLQCYIKFGRMCFWYPKEQVMLKLHHSEGSAYDMKYVIEGLVRLIKEKKRGIQHQGLPSN